MTYSIFNIMERSGGPLQRSKAIHKLPSNWMSKDTPRSSRANTFIPVVPNFTTLGIRPSLYKPIDCSDDLVDSRSKSVLFPSSFIPRPRNS
jgi:hypothetical protein